MKFAWIADKAGEFPITWMCRRLDVSPAGFYRWQGARPSLRATRDEQLATLIRVAHRVSNGVYGSPRIARELQQQGESVSRKRVARLMRREGLSGLRRRRFKRTTDSTHNLSIAKNLLDRNFSADQPNRVWASDLTYIRTWEGWLYLAVVVDLFSRRVVGWAIADNMRKELVLTALSNAVTQRSVPPGLLHHSDRGSQYASGAYQDALSRISAIPSMSRRGDCFDNAVVESFFGTLKQELIYRRSWPTRKDAINCVERYINGFYNTRRRHSFIGYVSPLEFELAATMKAAA